MATFSSLTGPGTGILAYSLLLIGIVPAVYMSKEVAGKVMVLLQTMSYTHHNTLYT